MKSLQSPMKKQAKLAPAKAKKPSMVQDQMKWHKDKKPKEVATDRGKFGLK